MKVKSILIIGAGKRVRETILPALRHLTHIYTIAGICSRTKKYMHLAGGNSRVQTMTSMEKVNFSSVDMIIVAVTTENVPDVLGELARYNTKHIILFLDTPVMRIKHLWATRYLSNFKNVYVSEDSIFLPNYLNAKKLIQKGAIGRLHHVYLFHNAYKYHGLATLKSLIDANFVHLITTKSYGSGMATLTLTFSAGVTATIIEPKDYTSGRFLIIGDEGSIADYPLNPDNTKLRIYRQKNKKHEDLKIEGLVRLYARAFDRNPTHSYNVWEGLYDNFVFACIKKIGFFADVKIPGLEHSVVLYLIKTLSWILRTWHTSH